MRYLAKIEKTNLVSNVVVIPDEVVNPDDYMSNLGLAGVWVETFEDGSKRGSMACVGYTYDSSKDMFIQNKPEDELSSDFILDETTGRWVPPVPKPEGEYWWNSTDKVWVEFAK